MKEKHTKEKIKRDDLYKEIDLIQACITRMADNSFRLKELYISLISVAITVMMTQESEWLIICIFLLCVTLIFWGLNAFFLKIETLYRWKYDWVIEMRKAGEQSYLFDLNPHNKDMWLDIKNKNECFMKFVFAKTLVPLYGTIEGASLLIIIYFLIVN